MSHLLPSFPFSFVRFSLPSPMHTQSLHLFSLSYACTITLPVLSLLCIHNHSTCSISGPRWYLKCCFSTSRSPAYTSACDFVARYSPSAMLMQPATAPASYVRPHTRHLDATVRSFEQPNQQSGRTHSSQLCKCPRCHTTSSMFLYRSNNVSSYLFIIVIDRSTCLRLHPSIYFSRKGNRLIP